MDRPKILSQPHFTPTLPSKVGNKIEGIFFWVLDPPSPLKTREICWIFFFKHFDSFEPKTYFERKNEIMI